MGQRRGRIVPHTFVGVHNPNGTRVVGKQNREVYMPHVAPMSYAQLLAYQAANRGSQRSAVRQPRNGGPKKSVRFSNQTAGGSLIINGRERPRLVERVQPWSLFKGVDPKLDRLLRASFSAYRPGRSFSTYQPGRSYRNRRNRTRLPNGR
jgi:hypothetical protein